MRKAYTEKTDTFLAYDLDNKEYLIHEFTLYKDEKLPEQPPRKIVVIKSYKTNTGAHVKKKDNSNYLILTEYGKKNIEIQKANY